MTCIIGLVNKGDVFLGGDRAATEGVNLDQFLLKEAKVFMRGDVGFGVCGLPKVMDVIKHVLTIPEDNEEDAKTYVVGSLIPAMRDVLVNYDCTIVEDNQAMIHGAVLIAYRGRLFRMEMNFQVTENSVGFEAAGCGAQPALGSLRATRGKGPKRRIIEALTVSAENNAGVKGPFDVIVVKSSK